MTLLQLYFVFFKIGLFTIGGGLASLPLLQEALVEEGLITQADFIDMIAISQSTPGPIGINAATFCGFQIASVSGGLVATLGIVSPSLIIIMLIAAFMKNFASRPAVQNAMKTIRPAAVGLIGSAVWFVARQALFVPAENESALVLPDFLKQISPGPLLLAGALVVFCRFQPRRPVLCILIGGIAGVLFFR